jgi:hypothetical protein
MPISTVPPVNDVQVRVIVDGVHVVLDTICVAGAAPEN